MSYHNLSSGAPIRPELTLIYFTCFYILFYFLAKKAISLTQHCSWMWSVVCLLRQSNKKSRAFLFPKLWNSNFFSACSFQQAAKLLYEARDQWGPEAKLQAAHTQVFCTHLGRVWYPLDIINATSSSAYLSDSSLVLDTSSIHGNFCKCLYEKWLLLPL